jgi:uncharacterized tellurite resistance protein B-like protein
MRLMERRIAFLKILIAAAWADDRLSPAEIRTLSYYLQRLRITAKEYESLRPLLEQPIPREEAQALIEEQLRLLSGTEEQRTLVAAVEGLLTSDDKLTAPEAKFLRELRQMTHNLPTAQVFISRLKTLWSDEKGPPGDAEGQVSVDRFIQQRLLEHFRGRIALTRARAGMAPDDGIADRDLYRVVLWAGLLGRVADADNELRPAEKDQLLDILRGVAGEMPEPDLQVVADASLDGSMSGIELKTLTGELLKLASGELGALLDSLFLVAAADGKLLESEAKVIREIAQGAGFDDGAYRASLARCKRRMRVGWN